jgi:hypothetical protein
MVWLFQPKQHLLLSSPYTSVFIGPKVQNARQKLISFHEKEKDIYSCFGACLVSKSEKFSVL